MGKKQVQPETSKRSVGFQRKSGHGSIAKAGKVRQVSPIPWNNYSLKSKTGTPYNRKHHKQSPRLNNKRKYHKLLQKQKEKEKTQT